jgi:hypothetical protein
LFVVPDGSETIVVVVVVLPDPMLVVGGITLAGAAT